MKSSSKPKMNLLSWIQIWTLALLMITGVLFIAEANAATEVSLLGGLNMSSASFSPAIPNVTVKNQSSILFGATADFAINPVWSVEFGALYGVNSIRLEVDGNNYVDTKQAALNIPVMARVHLGSMFSLGAGAYYNLTMGNSKTTTTAAGVTGSEVDSGSKSDPDYGAVVSAKFAIPLAAKMKFAIDGRYNLGLKEVDAGTSKAKFSSINALGGLVFEL